LPLLKIRRLIANIRSLERSKKVPLYSATLVLILSLIVSLILPAIQVRAEQTLTWTSNADFAYNKISGDCSATALEGLTINGAAYSDDTCVAAEEDSSLELTSTSAEMTNVQKVSAGGSANTTSHTLALSNDGVVKAFGYNGQGQLGNGTTRDSAVPVQVNTSTMTGTVTAISAGTSHSCAVADGKAYCWGDGGSGRLGNGSTSSSSVPVAVITTVMTGTVTSISAGTSHTCAIASGKAYCWGDGGGGRLGNGLSNSSVPLAVGTSLMSGTVTHIAAANDHTCAVASALAYCWGSVNSGKLGHGGAGGGSNPVAVSTSLMSGAVTSISTATNHSCAVAGGQAYCWGSASSGKLGNGTTTPDSNVPVAVTASLMSSTVTSISTGNSHSCAIAGGLVYCWGLGTSGQLGNSASSTSNVPVATTTSLMTGTVASIGTGNLHSCAIAGPENRLYCWGNNISAQVGLENYGSSALNNPRSVIENVSVEFLSGSTAISTGSIHSCAVAGGLAYCWGGGGSGNLGNNSTNSSSTPVAVDTSLMSGTVTDISVGSNHTCAIASGQAYCWGSGSGGKLGNNAGVQSNVPVAVNTSLMSGTVTDISAGDGHTCAVAGGQAYCWGAGGSGRLGNNATSQSDVPVAVNTSVMSGTATAISAGYDHSCAVAGGLAYCWGEGTTGQLGNGLSSTSNVPVAVNTSVMSGTATDISAGKSNSFRHTCAVASGLAYCWGTASSGKLGNNTTSPDTNVPVAVNTSLMSGTVTAISAGNNYSCAIASGQAYCWGAGGFGVLGNGPGTNSNVPVAVSTSSMSGTVTSLVAGFGSTTCAATGGQAYCWGFGSSGQIGSYGYSSSTGLNFPAIVTKSLVYIEGYGEQGTLNGVTFDAGSGKKARWNSIAWLTEALPATTSISFSVRTSDNNSDWSDWSSNFLQDADGTTNGFGDLTSLPMSRYIQIRSEFTSDNNANTPTLNDFTLGFLEDLQAPVSNASNLTMERQQGGDSITDGGWTNLPGAYFSWDAAADNVGGSGIQGYCTYIGQDNTADPEQTKGLLANSPLDVGGACPYAVASTELDLSVNGTLATALTTSNDPYYIKIKAIDYSGNIYSSTPASFSFKYDNTAPVNPLYVSAPSQFVSDKDVTLTWPTTGPESPSDATSGLAGLQYKIGSGGTWYGAEHNGNQDFTDLLPNSGSYEMNETYDYPALNEGNNVVYFRTYDNAGNTSVSNVTTVIKLNTSSPTQPQNLTATPPTNTTNSFAFSWLAPASHVGPASALTYCYTINTLPTSTNCNYTNAGQTSLAADAYATQPGSNTIYVVARDEAGNINYATYASEEFTANTPAPGIAKDFEIADVSTKASSLWKIALSWNAPDDVGAGVSKYTVYRSTNGSDFSQIASTSGSSYVDSSLSQIEYYYKIRACDSANNCGAFSATVSTTPTGRFTTPPELVGNVTTEVSTRTAKFSWVTDREGDSRVQLGTSSGVYQPSEVAVSSQVKIHTVELNNLDAGTTYYYKVKWTDEDGNTGSSSELTFTTLPAPTIQDVSVVKKSLTSALIQFTSTNASKVDLLYGKNDGFGGKVSVNTSRTQSTYMVELTGLDDGTTYLFKINTYDNEGNMYDSRRVDTFATSPRPRISDLRFQPVTGEPTSTQEVTWKTNVAADSTLTYGKVDTNGTNVYISEATTDHKITVRNLEDDSNYFLLAQSRDADGNVAVSDRQFFRTALDTRAPSISSIKVTTAIKGSGSNARGQIVMYWKTDEPATSQVAYGFGAGGSDYPNKTSQDGQLTTDHVVIISDLPVANVYHLHPISEDRSDNSTSGDGRSAVIGRPTESILNIIINSIQNILGI
jgi:alpha-tubulin suppressor-like RCC1 family protein